MGKVIAIGNALVDILVKLKDDTLLDQFDLAKGSMQLVDMGIGKEILAKAKEMNLETFQASGGSAANTIHGLAQLGVPSGYIGKVGDDEIGDFFQKDMEIQNITTLLSLSTTPSGRANTLISPDSERTFGTYLGAAVELNANDLNKELFEGYQYFHVEGYLVQNNELLETALKLAKQQGLKISLDLASFNVVEENLEFLKDMAEKYIDIIFANEEEAKAFTGKEPREALDSIASICEIAVVKVGKDGSYVKSNDHVVKVDGIKANSLDTTGAGDLYAAGFIYGLIKRLGLEKCAKIGGLLGGKVIEVIGAKMTSDTWNNILQEIETIEKI
jgi:sugar/nucleoside kinase (ribokinase family)